MYEKPEHKKASDLLVRGFAEHLLAVGLLTEEDLGNKRALAEKIITYSRTAEFVPVTDHTESLLESAAGFAEVGQEELAILLYATYFEHAMNNIIDHALLSAGASEKTKNDAIRAVNVSGKCGWFLEILHLPAFNPRHAKFINDLAAERNAFVHYKWGAWSDSKEKKKNLIAQARKTATYVKKYTSRVLFGGNRAALHEALTIKSSGRKKTRRCF